MENKNCFIYGFAVIGVFSTIIFIILLGIFGYLWISDPFELRSSEQVIVNTTTGDESQDSTEITSPTVSETETYNFTIPKQYENLLAAVGITKEDIERQDPKILEACIEQKLGSERTAQLKEGTMNPGISDAIALKKCIKK